MAELSSRATRALFIVTLGACTCLVSRSASAQWQSATTGVLGMPEMYAAPSDATAVTYDPAALAWLEAYSVIYAHADASSRAELGDRGDSLHAAVPLPFGLGLGAEAQSVRPTSATGLSDRALAGVSLAWASSRSLAIGSTVRTMTSNDARFDGVTSLDLAVAWRPWSWLAFSLLARDLTSPRLGYTNALVARTFIGAVSIRPFGTRDLTLEAATAVDTDGNLGLRFAAALRVPYVGRVFAATEMEHTNEPDRSMRAMFGVTLDWGQVGVGGGVVVGDGFGSSPGMYVTARLEGMHQRGIPTPRSVLSLDIEDLGARSLLRTMWALERARTDPRVAGVLLRVRGSGVGMAGAQELRLAIAELRAAGKPVVCHLDGATGAELYACRTADRVLVDPAGGVRLVGPSQQMLLLGELLSNVGLRADFVRIGEFKSAPEELINRELSAPARIADEALLSDVYGRFVSDLAGDLSARPGANHQAVTPEQVRALVDRGPYAAQEALDAHLVDALADDHDLDAQLEDAFGGSYGLSERLAPVALERWGVPARIGVLVIDGDIIDGQSIDVPIVDVHMSGGRTVIEALEALDADPSVRAIIVRIDSPGGSALASDQIWRALSRARAHKPIIASFGSMAASGGYYVGSACHEIWADPATITGSIGIFYGKVDGAALARRLGIGIEVLSRGQRAGVESVYQPFTPDERAMLADKVRIWYKLFLDRVAAGRGMTPAEVDSVGRGRIWSGDAALAHHLVDHLGGFSAALARARTLANLGERSDVVFVPRRPRHLVDYVLGSMTGSGAADASTDALADAPATADAPIPLPADLRRLLATASVFAGMRADIPMALVPYDIDLR